MLPEEMTNVDMNVLAVIASVDSLADPQSAYYIRNHLQAAGYEYSPDDILASVNNLNRWEFVRYNTDAMGAGEYYIKYTLTQQGRTAAYEVQSLADTQQTK